MPRLLLRDRRVVEDEWLYAAEAEGQASAPLIISLEQWQDAGDAWLARGTALGVVLQPEHKVESLGEHLVHFGLIALPFSGPSEGRGYSQARMLREQLNFKGELRASGYVHRDQLFFMARCGFNSFEMPDAEFAAAEAALSTFSYAYQPANDAGLPLKLQRR
jgi:uncharacterized protein (DUF934 family)